MQNHKIQYDLLLKFGEIRETQAFVEYLYNQIWTSKKFTSSKMKIKQSQVLSQKSSRLIFTQLIHGALKLFLPFFVSKNVLLKVESRKLLSKSCLNSLPRWIKFKNYLQNVFNEELRSQKFKEKFFPGSIRKKYEIILF